MTQIARVTQSLALRELIEAIRRVTATEVEEARVAARVADLMKPVLGDPNLLPTKLEPDQSHYRQHTLHVEADGSFSVVALVWLPGQATPIHDHVSWCVVGVYQGQEHETRYRLEAAAGAACLIEAGEAVSAPGTVTALTPPGDIHRVDNPGPQLAVSLHIYGADIQRLGSSIRRCYTLETHPAQGEPAAGEQR